MADPVRKRVYICRVIGTGKHLDPYRAEVVDLVPRYEGRRIRAMIDYPRILWCLAEVWFPDDAIEARRIHNLLKAAGCHDFPASLGDGVTGNARDKLVRTRTGHPLTGGSFREALETMACTLTRNSTVNCRKHLLEWGE